MRSMHRLTSKMRDAMRRYYNNRKKQHEVKWDKDADLDYIIKSKSRSVIMIQCVAGTFFIWWRDGVETIHKEENYYRGMIFCRRRKNGKWYQLRDWNCTKIKPKLIT